MQPLTPYEAYHHATETLNHTAQILMLYDSSISYIRQAKAAIAQNDFDTRYQKIDKAMSIMRGLHTCLDFNASEEIALAMDRYYVAIDNLMVAAQCDNNPSVCDAIIENLLTIRKVWAEISHYSATFLPPANDSEEEPKNLLI